MRDREVKKLGTLPYFQNQPPQKTTHKTLITTITITPYDPLRPPPRKHPVFHVFPPIPFQSRFESQTVTPAGPAPLLPGAHGPLAEAALALHPYCPPSPLPGHGFSLTSLSFGMLSFGVSFGIDRGGADDYTLRLWPLPGGATHRTPCLMAAAAVAEAVLG